MPIELARTLKRNRRTIATKRTLCVDWSMNYDLKVNSINLIDLDYQKIRLSKRQIGVSLADDPQLHIFVDCFSVSLSRTFCSFRSILLLDARLTFGLSKSPRPAFATLSPDRTVQPFSDFDHPVTHRYPAGHLSVLFKPITGSFSLVFPLSAIRTSERYQVINSTTKQLAFTRLDKRNARREKRIFNF